METEIKKEQLIEITFDKASNVVTQHEGAAIKRGIAEEVRKYFHERMISHRMDVASIDDQTQSLKIKGRILELQALLDLFKV